MVITSNSSAPIISFPTGSVGIGTSSPAVKLVVSGAVYLNQTADYFGATTTIQMDSAGSGNSIGFRTNTFYLYPFSSNTAASLWYGYNGFTSWRLSNVGGHARFGIFNSGSSELVSIAYSGNVGIGTTSPVAKLEVNNSTQDSHFFAIGTAPSINLMNANTAAQYQGTMGMATTSNHFFTGTVAGDLCIANRGTTSGSIYFGCAASVINASLTTAGTFTARGDVVAFGTPSDISFKTNIVPIENSLDKIIGLEPVYFTWKEDVKSSKLAGIKDDIGFIAQQVQEILPELVKSNDDGTLSLRERGIIPLLVGAIKEQQKQIDELKYLLQSKT